MREIFLRKQSSILSAALIIMITYGLSHVLGLVKSRLLISYFFGGNAALLDVYYASMIIPETVFQLLVMGALSAAFIPIFSKYLARDEKQAWEVAGLTVNSVLLVMVLVTIAIFIFARPLAILVAPGFSASQISIMVNLLRVMLFSQIFFALSGFLTGTIQSNQRFLLPAIAPLAYNLGIILGIVLLTPFLGIYGPAAGMVFGAVLHMAIQLPVAISLGFKFVPRFNFKHPGVIEIIKLMPPRMLAMGIDQVEQFTAVILASQLVSGSLSLFNVARLLYAIPTLLFGSTIGQAALPALSSLAAQKKWPEFRKTLMDSCLQVIFLALPICVLLIVLRVPVVRLAFGAKTFPWEATLLTGKTLAVLLISAGFYAVMQIIVRAYYALHDTTTPLIVGIIAAVVNVVLSIVFVNTFNLGIIGIASALSITSVVETLILSGILLHKQFPTEEISLAGKSFFKLIFLGFATGMGLWIPMQLLDQFVFDTTRTLPLLILTIITSVIGLSLYLVLSYILKIDQFSAVLGLWERIKSWRSYLAAPARSEPIILPTSEQN